MADVPTPTQGTTPGKGTRRWGKVAWVASTNFGEGFPWSFMHQMATDYLTAIRAPVQQVGYTSWLHFATTLKFLWGPPVDTIGTKRSWMVAMQGLLSLGMLAVAFVSTAGTEALGPFWGVLIAMAVMSATHDVACDGFYMLGLDRREQAAYAGGRVAAFRLATWLGSSVLVTLAGRTSWKLGFAVAAVLMLLLAVSNGMFLPRVERGPAPAEPAAPRHHGPRKVLEAYKTFFTQPHAALVLAFLFTFKLGDIMTFAMSRPLLRDLGVNTATRGLIGSGQTVAQIAGAVVGGWVVSRFTLARVLVPVTYFMALPLYIPLAWFRPNLGVIAATVVFEQFCGVLGSTVQSIYIMQRCSRTFSASHFAFATAIVALGSTVTGGFSGHLNAALGHAWYFVACFGFSVPGLILVWFVPKRPIETDDDAGVGRSAR